LSEVLIPPPGASGPLSGMRKLLAYPRAGKRLAAEVDRGGFDAAFCFASQLTEAPPFLPYLRTPSLYYAPEPLRVAYEPAELFYTQPGPIGWLLRRRALPSQRLARFLDRRFLGEADRVVTHSRFTATELERIYGVQADVVPLGVDSQLFSPGPDASAENYVLSVGALAPVKGHQLVVEAVSLIEQPRPAVVVIGDRGDEDQPLRRLAEERGVQLTVRCRVPLEKLLDAYRRAAVIACAQIREPFGLVPLEAMACGRPVVAVAEGGFLETVDNGRTGILVPRDPQAFAAAIAMVLRDDELARRLGSEGRREAASRFTWERAVKAFDDLLAEVAAAARQPAAGSGGPNP